MIRPADAPRVPEAAAGRGEVQKESLLGYAGPLAHHLDWWDL
jgi:hypothetical protein